MPSSLRQTAVGRCKFLPIALYLERAVSVDSLLAAGDGGDRANRNEVTTSTRRTCPSRWMRVAQSETSVNPPKCMYSQSPDARKSNCMSFVATSGRFLKSPRRVTVDRFVSQLQSFPSLVTRSSSHARCLLLCF